jgi:hypothetical protein
MTPIEFIDNLPYHRRSSLRLMAEELNKAGILTPRGCQWTAASVFAEYRRNELEYCTMPKREQNRITKAMRNLSRAESLIRSSVKMLQQNG